MHVWGLSPRARRSGENKMNGAESVVRTLVGGGVDVCFANPGTSEMHFVAALDRVDGMRCVLGLFEGVVTGAADGYYRMSDNPAATLLHLGPGLANGLASIHNANKAASGMVNIIGDHATYHRQYDAPLTSDIEGLARPSSHWVKTSPDAMSIARDGAAAIAAARTPPGQIASLILPADTAWNDGSGPMAVPPAEPPAAPSREAVAEAARVLRSGEPTLILLTGRAVRADGLELAGKIAAKCGARLMAQGSNARTQRGRGRVSVERIPYVVDQALKVLDGLKHVILVGTKMPVAFFAYPNKPSQLTPQGCEGHVLARPEEDQIQAREGLDITTVLFANRTYQILKGELANVGAGNPGRKALDMLDLGKPDIDWVGLARGLGVPGAKVTTMEEFNRRFADAVQTPGPFLVEVVL